MTGLTIPFVGIKKQYNNLRQEILDVTDEVLRSGLLLNGNYTAEFENWLAKKNGQRYAVTCHSGTQALEMLALYLFQQASSLHAQPTILIPSLTYVASANAFANAGWHIVFADVDRYGIINANTKDLASVNAVLLIGLYGAAIANCMDRKEFSLSNSVICLEDGAQHWLSDNCRRSGLATAISFDPTKNLANFGNGGAIVTNDFDLFNFVSDYKNNGKLNAVRVAGTNSKMSEIDCAQMMVKCHYLDQWQERRKKIAVHWLDRLKVSDVRPLIDSSNLATHCFHKFVVELNDRDSVQAKLAAKKIQTKIHYEQPVHEQGLYQAFAGPGFLNNSSALSRRVLSLPLYAELSDLEVEYVIDSLLDCV